MSKENKVQLKPSCILTVPIQTYDNDFTFIVNGEEFKTSRLVSDILSPIICKNHSYDPTIDSFTINTKEQGDFSRILQLVNFNEISFPENEINFISEVIEILGNESIECDINPEITINNIFTHIKNDEKKGIFYRQRFSSEIDFISSHFYEICENQEEELINLSIDSLFEILNNDHLQLKSEDQLLNFVNGLYSKSGSVYSILYETVFFENVSTESILNFLSIYDVNDITGNTWNRLSMRLSLNVNKETDQKIERYIKGEKNGVFSYSKDNEFNGILNHLVSKFNNEIDKVLNVTASSSNTGIPSLNIVYDPKNVILYNENLKIFYSKDMPNSWICFDFKDHKIIPTNYTLKSSSTAANGSKPKSWVIEGSNDNNSWEVIDEQVNCDYLNGSNLIHTFKINQQKSNAFQYIRMRLTGVNWQNNNCLIISKIEFYGQFI